MNTDKKDQLNRAKIKNQRLQLENILLKIKVAFLKEIAREVSLRGTQNLGL